MTAMAPTDQELAVRPYNPADRDALLRIAADTAAFGAPVETFFDDRRLFSDAVYSYYVDYEPEHAWIAAVGDEVVGFLVGCTDTGRHDRVLAQKIVPALVLNLLRSHYRLGQLTGRHLRAEVEAGLRGERAEADLALYPAHLHINLDVRSRGHGAGRRLMEAYLDQLRSLRVPGVHLHTTNLNAAAVTLYTKLGFVLLDARPTKVWSEVTAEYVESRCYGLRIDFADESNPSSQESEVHEPK
jgi:GNAT superfamily N-acetyltransferase